jgi:sugar phosphate isomerase/epimerase
VSIHLKDWLVTNPEIGIKDGWTRRGRFCELGAGNIGLDNAAVLRELRAVGYDGWILVEHDTHLRDPRLDLAVSRRYLREAGI